jgi:ketosteroid isomerase-like protein
MNQQLVDGMWSYLRAGLDMDLAALDRIYDPEFENVRVDQAGQTVTLTKEHFMARFRALREQGERIGESIDDVTFPATSDLGDQAVVVMRRVKDDEPVLYTFVWRMRDGHPTTMLREFTFDRDISYLLKLMSAR